MTLKIHSDQPADDLLFLSGMIADVGNIISELNFSEKKHETETAYQYGETLGSVVSMCADAMKDILAHNYRLLPKMAFEAEITAEAPNEKTNPTEQNQVIGQG